MRRQQFFVPPRNIGSKRVLMGFACCEYAISTRSVASAKGILNDVHTRDSVRALEHPSFVFSFSTFDCAERLD